jgi:hypothetical protein
MTQVRAAGTLWDMLRGALVTRALALAADLRIADELAAGPQHVDELARRTGADATTLHRVLRALASDGAFAEVERGVFRNTEISELLRAGTGWGEFAHLFGGVWHGVAGGLDVTGEPSFPRLHGSDFWAWLAEHPGERVAFDRAMVQGWESRVERLGRVPWRGDETVVDVGGGNGSLLIEFLRDRSGMRGIVFDLPETVRNEAALGDRIDFAEGSFFDFVPEGDAYVLSTVLHDWGDAEATAILRTIRRHATDGARLVVLDAVIPAGNDPDGSKWLDLLVLGLLGGRERDEKDWRSLLEATGFEIDAIEDGLVQAHAA